jgi:hypothetical protein
MVTSSLLNTHLRDNLNAVRITYGTTLPGSPSDGELAVLVNSLTSPTYHWQFRYNASNTTAYKWEFIGGSALNSAAANISFANQTSYVMTDSPAATVAPRAGVYDIIITGTAEYASGNTTFFSYNINGSGASDSFASKYLLWAGSLHFVRRAIELAANDQVRIAYRSDGTGTNHYLDNARLSLMPVRVS